MPDSPLLTLLHNRHATRAILSDPLPETTVTSLMEAIRLTPSCSNNQPWRYLFIQSEDALSKAREAFTGGNRAWAPRAPLLVVGYSKASDDCQPSDGREYHQFDTGMSAMNLMLEATAQGLVARPMAGWKPSVLRDAFDFDDEDELIVMIAIGKPGTDESHLPAHYKGNEDKPRKRKKTSEIIRML